MRAAGRSVLACAAGVLALSATGCGEGDAAPESTPGDAVVISENEPHDLGGASVVATGVHGDEATLEITTDGPARPVEVTEGGEVTISGESYTVEAVWSEGDGDQPGAAGGRVIVVPAGD